MADKGKMTDQEVVARLVSMQVRHHAEIAESVARFCIGRSVQQVAQLIGKSESWVIRQLDRSAVEEAMDWVHRYESRKAKTTTVDEILAVVESCIPEESDWECIWDYEERGHVPEVAKRLAGINHAAWEVIRRMALIEPD